MKKAVNPAKAFVLLVCAATMVGTAGCQSRKEGTLEKMGREVDDTVEDATHEKSTADKVGEKIRDIGEDIEDRG